MTSIYLLLLLRRRHLPSTRPSVLEFPVCGCQFLWSFFVGVLPARIYFRLLLALLPLIYTIRCSKCLLVDLLLRRSSPMTVVVLGQQHIFKLKRHWSALWLLVGGLLPPPSNAIMWRSLTCYLQKQVNFMRGWGREIPSPLLAHRCVWATRWLHLPLT